MTGASMTSHGVTYPIITTRGFGHESTMSQLKFRLSTIQLHPALKSPMCSGKSSTSIADLAFETLLVIGHRGWVCQAKET